MNPHTGKWLKLLALMPAIAMVFTDQSVLPVALPSIQEHLGATHAELWWCINAYLLVSAVLLLAGGKIGDRIGHRAAFLWGMIVFAIASAFCGVAFNIYWLIVARGLQGIGAALMVPASSPLIMAFFPQNERGKAIGVNVSISSLFMILAPLIGGYLTENLSWRWIFWINLPIALFGVILVLAFIPRSAKGKHSFDPWGFSYFLIGTTCLVIPIMQSGDWGWLAEKSIALYLISITSICLFIWREKHSKHPFIDLSLFRHPIYKAVNISIFAVQFVLMITVYRAVFFQDAVGWSPFKSGLILSITSCPVLFMSPLGGWLADRSGPKVPIAIGFTLLIFSFFWLAFFVQSTLPIVLIGLVAFGIGVPLIFTPSYSSAMGSIPPKKAGIAFGILATVRSLAATFGVALISSFVAFLQFNSFKNLLGNDPTTKELDPLFLERLATGVKHIPETLSTEQFQLVEAYLKNSQIQSFRIIHAIIAFILILAFAAVFVLYHRKASHHLPEAPAEGWD